ncbi:MAG: cupin domain-containing protein [Deltaproteobacteria bacterium]|nr:cupin domain-containing protein [Deltaproteobacteria bacterium]
MCFPSSWGHELLFARTKDYVGKILVIHKGEELSLQYHEQKEESIYVACGKLEVEMGDENLVLSQGQNLHIPPGTRHRFKALENSEIFEVSTPHLEDVVRLKDRYGRV